MLEKSKLEILKVLRYDSTYDNGDQVNSVQKVDNFEINGENLGESIFSKKVTY